MLYNRSLLVMYFKCNNVYMSIPNSQFIPPPIAPEKNTLEARLHWITCLCVLLFVCCVHVQVCGHVLIFLGYILRRGRVCLVLQETARPFTKTVVPLYIPTNNLWEFQLLYILTSTWCEHDQSLSCVGLYATLWTVACQAPLFMGFPGVHWDSCPSSQYCKVISL